MLNFAYIQSKRKLLDPVEDSKQHKTTFRLICILFLPMKLKRLKESRSHASSHVHVNYGTIAAIVNVLGLTV